MLQKIDDLLNGITMYRLITYILGLLAVVALVFSFTGVLDYKPIEMMSSLLIVMTAGFITNQLLPRLWGVSANAESGLITSFIVFFLVSPVSSVAEAVTLTLITIIALASKYVIAYQGKHIFNPAAYGVFLVGILGLGHASWWVGSSVLWPFTLVLGLLVARKTRRLSMVGVFFVVSVVGSILVAHGTGIQVSENLELLLLSSPLIFLGTIMLTEPSTMPPTRTHQWVYAGLAGFLFATHFEIGELYIYPETALLLANLYAFAVSPKRRWRLRLIKRHKITNELYDYEFHANGPMQFSPGQYMELTMPVKKQDDRGNRRTFTIASSPTERTVHVGVRIPANPSRFKQTLTEMESGATIQAGQIAGSFVMPRNHAEKLLFIAGGVGITPFRSMIKYLSDKHESRDIILVYLAKSENEFMFKQLLSAAEKVGVKTVYIAGNDPLRQSTLETHVPDLLQRKVYISGPPFMLRHIKRVLTSLGASRRSIKTDYFSGY